MNAFLLQTGGIESIKPQLEVKNKYKKEKESNKNELSPIGRVGARTFALYPARSKSLGFGA
jgi:hypothetical protein